jgi:transcriptional regulator with XRE-family HTH domain
MVARSQKIIMTTEARVLKQMRQERNLSMRDAAQLVGISISTVAHVENGRMNAPKGKSLARFLNAYGGMKEKSFYERVRNFKEKITPKDELMNLLERATDDQIKTIIQITRGLLGS